jgi:hypothetical protein
MTRKLSLALLLAGLTIAAGGMSAAQDYGRRDGGPRDAMRYSRATGGYCDSRGCPDRFWQYRVYYGPVYYHGTWFRGPVYVKDDRGRHYFWVAGGWHRDEWHADRPRWARNAHFGAPLPRSYYETGEFSNSDYYNGGYDTRSGRDYGQRDDGRGNQRDYSGNYQGNSDYGNRNRQDGGREQNGAGYRAYNDQSNAPQNTRGYNEQNRDNAQPGAWDQNRRNEGGRNYGGSNPDQNQNYTQNGRGAGQGGGQNNTISVTSATYGAICKVPKGNFTSPLQSACNGKSTCQYTVQFAPVGDPAPGCAKDFAVEWTCGSGGSRTIALIAEAIGSRISLTCNGG